MDREQFIECIRLIMQHEGWQVSKCRTTKSSLTIQRRCINKLAKQIGVDKLSMDEVIKQCSWG